jgi:hypothetical protein
LLRKIPQIVFHEHLVALPLAALEDVLQSPAALVNQ